MGIDMIFSFHLDGDAYTVEAEVIDWDVQIMAITDEDGDIPLALTKEVFLLAEFIALSCFMDKCANTEFNDILH